MSALVRFVLITISTVLFYGLAIAGFGSAAAFFANPAA
jgi:hypothetical protein